MARKVKVGTVITMSLWKRNKKIEPDKVVEWQSLPVLERVGMSRYEEIDKMVEQ